MGKQEYKWRETYGFGQLPKVEKKAISKVADRRLDSAFDHATICTGQIAAVLACFESHNWRTADCVAETEAMHACVDAHKDDPNPKVLARQWQTALQRRVYQHFVRAHVARKLLR